MIDVRAARNDPERFRAALARRGAAEAFDALMAADARWRELVPQVDELRAQQKLQGKPTPEQLEELKARKARLSELEAELAAAEAERDAALAKVPNPPHESAADGMTEEDAVEIKRWGEPPQLAEPKEHTEIGRFELERAAKVSGSRFGFIVGDTALVALALYRFALDRLSREGFTTVIPPVLVREEAMYGTGFFPSDKSDYYEIPADGLYLVGTSEVPLVAMHMDEILETLPIHYCAFSSCFRRESGAAGRDTRGMFRVHQFQKVEMVVYTRAGEVVGRARADARDRGVARAGARHPVPRREHRGGRPLGRGGEAVRHRGLVPVAGALPRADVVLEHDGLPGAALEDSLPRGREVARDAAHVERDRGDRPLVARVARELPGRGARKRCSASARRPA